MTETETLHESVFKLTTVHIELNNYNVHIARS